MAKNADKCFSARKMSCRMFDCHYQDVDILFIEKQDENSLSSPFLPQHSFSSDNLSDLLSSSESNI